MRLVISASARRDIASALVWSERHWGPTQRDRYRTLIAEALDTLLQDPQHPLSRARDEIRPGMRSLHIARRGRQARHFIVYRLTPEGDLQVIRLLHDAMEPSRALSNPR